MIPTDRNAQASTVHRRVEVNHDESSRPDTRAETAKAKGTEKPVKPR